ncbi:MAG: hypothetical protein SGARI_006851 [Bacillariaceae sp.]
MTNFCQEVSNSITATLFISLVMYLPSITTDILRMYPHYDVNCQKIFGGFAAVISLAFAFYTFVVYQFRCFRNMGFGTICLSAGCGDAFGIDDVCEVVEPDASNGYNCPTNFASFNRLFFAGPGWIALATASGLKIFDMIMNIAIPTPSICWTLEEQQEYEDKYGNSEAKDVVVEGNDEEESL